jgi:hypothetical protein
VRRKERHVPPTQQRRFAPFELNHGHDVTSAAAKCAVYVDRPRNRMNGTDNAGGGGGQVAGSTYRQAAGRL